VAHFDRAIPPGGEGIITLSVRTSGYHGKIHKSARIISNDPTNKYAQVGIKAFVKVSIRVSSRYVYLFGPADQKITRVVNITAGLQKPLKIEPVSFDLADRISYSIKETEKGRHYLVRLTSIPGTAGRFHGALKLKTNYPEKSEITIYIRARFE